MSDLIEEAKAIVAWPEGACGRMVPDALLRRLTARAEAWETFRLWYWCEMPDYKNFDIGEIVEKARALVEAADERES